MNKSELIDRVARGASLTQWDATRAVNAALQAIIEGLANGETLKLKGFGNFEPMQTKERVGHNPSTGTEIIIPAGVRPVFYPSKVMKKIVNWKNGGNEE